MSNPNDFYIGYQGSTEPSMRQEMINTVYGTEFPEIPKGMKVLLRKMQIVDDKPVLCSCVDATTKEADRDVFCPICFGEGYIWTEEFITFYKVNHEPIAVMDKQRPSGLVNIDINVAYLPYDISVNSLDRIVEVDLDLEGAVVYPIKRTKVWHIQQIIPLRADYARLEFTKIFITDNDPKWLNQPGV